MIRSDLALALSTGFAPGIIAALDDREKATLWQLLEDYRDQQEQGRG